MNHTRREFVKASVASAAILSAPGLLTAKNRGDKIRMGFIGVGNRGTKLLRAFRNPDVQVAALCDVYQPYLTRNKSAVDAKIIDSIGSRVPPLDEAFAGHPKQYSDFRKLLEDKNIDAVCIATPDHWHAVQTICANDFGV